MIILKCTKWDISTCKRSVDSWGLFAKSAFSEVAYTPQKTWHKLERPWSCRLSVSEWSVWQCDWVSVMHKHAGRDLWKRSYFGWEWGQTRRYNASLIMTSPTWGNTFSSMPTMNLQSSLNPSSSLLFNNAMCHCCKLHMSAVNNTIYANGLGREGKIWCEVTQFSGVSLTRFNVVVFFWREKDRDVGEMERNIFLHCYVVF